MALPSFSSIGGYPIIYLTSIGEVLCADCAGGSTEVHTAQLYEEGSPLACDTCGTEIESAYGDNSSQDAH